MERHIYTWQSDITGFQYPLEYEDLSWDLAKILKHILGRPSEIMRSWVNVTVNLQRMEAYVLAGVGYFILVLINTGLTH